MRDLIVFGFALGLGLVPAFIARSKGRSFWWWWLGGFLLLLPVTCLALVVPGAGEPYRFSAPKALLLFAAILGTAAVVLVSILLVRLLNNYLPDSVFGEEHVWAAHLLIGLVFSGFALWLWSKRKPLANEG